MSFLTHNTRATARAAADLDIYLVHSLCKRRFERRRRQTAQICRATTSVDACAQDMVTAKPSFRVEWTLNTPVFFWLARTRHSSEVRMMTMMWQQQAPGGAILLFFILLCDALWGVLEQWFSRKRREGGGFGRIALRFAWCYLGGGSSFTTSCHIPWEFFVLLQKL